MNCKQVEELLPLYAGHDLEEKRATLVTEHMQTCAACARVADEYRESVRLTEQFVPPIFSDAVYAGIRQRVLREIETETMAPAWSQTIASLFQTKLTWAIAGVLLIVVSMFAINFIMNKGNDEQQLAKQPPAQSPANVQPETKERSNSDLQDNSRTDHPHSVNTGEKKQQLAGVSQPQRKKRSRDTPSKLPQPVLFPYNDSAALAKPLRVEIQTRDPKIRIIWFVQPETKPVIPASKGT